MRPLTHHLCADNEIPGYDLAELAHDTIRAALGDLIENLLPPDHSTERRGIPIKLRGCNQRNEELAARPSRSILNGGDSSPKMTPCFWRIELIRNRVTWTAHSIVGGIGIFRVRISPHHHVARVCPIERGAIVKTRFHQMNKITHGRGGLVF